MQETRTETQFSVFLVNKPGVLAQVTGALAKAKVNVVAMTLVDSGKIALDGEKQDCSRRRISIRL